MPRRHLLGTGAAALILAHGGGALAAEAATPVDELIVTATRGGQGLKADKIGSSVTVISAQDMADRQVRIVSDVLRDVPGFAVSRLGAAGGQTQVRVRGAEANHVLTLIDGIEAADPFQGEFDFAGLISDEVARIEVLRGAQSALYGSDAVAGVIHYITPTAREAPGARMRVEAGSQGTFGGSARYGLARGPLDLVVNAGVQTTDGYVTQTLPGGRRRVGAEQESFSGKLGYELSEALSLRGVIRYANAHADTNSSRFGRGLVDSPGAYSDSVSLTWLAGGDLRLMDGAWTHSASVQGLDAERNAYGAGGRTGGNEGARTKVSYVTAYRRTAGALTHTLTGAADWEKETFQNTSPASAGADTTRRSIEDLGLVGQYDLQIGDNAGIGAALRYDDNDFFADATTWKLQGFYRLNPMLRLRAAGGTGIKNPSQVELFGFNATGPFPFRGNPNLKPEKSRGWEAGADLTLWDGRATLGATWFQAKLKDEIFGYFGGAAPAGCPVPPPGVSTTCNRAFDSRQRGFELFGDIRILPGLKVSGTYTDLSARENGLQEIRRAPHIGSANVTWTSLGGRARVNLNVRYNGRQLDSNFSGIGLTPAPAGLPKVNPATGADAGKVVLPAFTLVNIAASYDLNDHVQVFGRVENLADEAYYEVFSYPAQGRTGAVGARVRF